MAPDTRIGPKGPNGAGRSLPQASHLRKRGSGRSVPQNGRNQPLEGPYSANPADQAPNGNIFIRNVCLARSMLSGANRSMLLTAARPAGHSCQAHPFPRAHDDG
jgi:hypothetical protein